MTLALRLEYLPAFEIRCHRCSGLIGLSASVGRIRGLFEIPDDGERLRIPREWSWRFRCQHCGWLNVFEVVDNSKGSS